MKLHSTVVDKLLKIYDIYGGHREEVKLREELLKLDVAMYEQQNPPYHKIVVLTEDTKR